MEWRKKASPLRDWPSKCLELLAEVALQQAFESFAAAAASFVIFMHGVVNGIQLISQSFQSGTVLNKQIPIWL